MKKGLKLFVSRAMLMVLICTIILPLFPPIKVEAADDVVEIKSGETFKENGNPLVMEYNGCKLEFIPELCKMYDTPSRHLFNVSGGTDDIFNADDKSKDKITVNNSSLIAEKLRGQTIKNKAVDWDKANVPDTYEEWCTKVGVNKDNMSAMYAIDFYAHSADTGFLFEATCDYNKENDRYYYTVLSIEYHGTLHAKEDDFLYLNFTSTDFIKFTLKDSVTNCDVGWVGNGSVASWFIEDIGIEAEIKLPPETALNMLKNIYDKDAIINDFSNFAEHANISGSSKYKIFDKYFRIVDSDGDEYDDNDIAGKYIALKAPYSLEVTHDENMYTLELYKSSRSDENLCMSGVTLPTSDEDGLKEFINFGDMQTIGGSDPMIRLFMDIFCDMCKVDSIDVNDFGPVLKDFSDAVGPYSSVLGRILRYYATAVTEASEQCRFDQAYNLQNPILNPEFSTIDSTDCYTIMSYILGYNLYCMVSGENFNSAGYIELKSPGVKIGGDNLTRVCMSLNIEDKKPGQASIKDLWELCGLSVSDRVALADTYRCSIDSLSNSVNTNQAILEIKSYDGMGYDPDLVEEFATTNSLLFDNIKDLITNRKDDVGVTNSIYNVARNCNVLTQYYIATKLYGASESNGGIYEVYDATLASLLPKTGQYSTSINDGYYPYVPLRNIGLFGEYNKYLSILNANDDKGVEQFYSLMSDIAYSFDVAEFSEGGVGEYDSATLRKYLCGDKSVSTPFVAKTSKVLNESNNGGALTGWLSPGTQLNTLNGKVEEFNNDEFSINMIRSIIELYDLCKFLDIYEDARDGKWTESISNYLWIYEENRDFFEGARENPAIYAIAPVGESNVEEPLGMFFMIKDNKMSDQWCKGFAASALFVPMETNLYDATSIAYVTDSEFISNFYYKYAFYRKALYINTDNSAIVNEKVSGQKSGIRVATLRDLINYDRDIVLTVDDNFYNAKDVGDVIGALDYNAIRNGSDTNTDNAWDSLKNWTSELFNLAPDQILKTGPVNYYSTTLASGVTKLGGTVTLKSRFADVYLLSQDQLLGTEVIDDSNATSGVFDTYEYSVKVPYGVVSAVYRDAELYNECLRAIASDNAIFKSSKGICSVPGSNSSDWRAVYNYCMLANLEDQMKNDAASSLDLNAPIFCDIFGNIVTESGLVIIPAAANATLCGKAWTPCTVGWSEYYNNGNRLHTGEFSDEVYAWLTGMEYDSTGAQTTTVQYIDHYDADGNPVYASKEITTTNTTLSSSNGKSKKENGGGYFVIDRGGVLILRTSDIGGKSAAAIVQWENLNKNSAVIKELFYNDAYYGKCDGGNIYNKTLVNLVVETMRGAPIEYIDYEYEGLAGNTDISKFGVYMAYKLEELTNALISGTNGNALGGNSAVTMPNLAFVSGIEYIVLYVFKIVFAIMLVGLAISLYLDAVKNHLGIKSVGKFLVTCMMTIVALTLVPNLISWSYYKANKELLTEESGYIMMLNYVKAFDGAEIGITSIETPETTTKLYLKMDDISINWWDIIGEVLFNNTYKTVSELYSNQLKDSPMAMQDNVQMKGDGLYVDVQDVFDSTNIIYYPNQKILQNVAYSNASKAGSAAQLDSTVVSFNMPYYVFLDKLVASINEYNLSMDTEAYSYSVGSNGHIMTYDIISPYLTSNEFLDEGFDILGLNEILETGVNLTSYTGGMFTGEYSWGDAQQAYTYSGPIGQMKKSRWYPSGTTTDQLTQQKINEVYEYARNWIARNRNVLGKVPDEVFLKVFCMELAIKYNKAFGIHTTNSIEIMNIDTRDLARLMIADRASVYKYYSYGFARFTYEQSGTIGVIFVAIYFVILWITSMIKPILMVVILALLIINVLGRKMLFRKESRCIEGYLIGCACLVMCNYAYALMLKATMSVASLGFGTVAAMAIAIFVQLLYVIGLILICAIEVKDWKNNGFHEFATIGSSITSGLMHAQNVVVEKLLAKNNSAYKDSSSSRRYMSDDYDATSVSAMLDRDAEREENALNVI